MRERGARGGTLRRDTLTAGEVTVKTASGTTSGNPITVEVTHQVDLLLALALGLPPPTIVRHATMAIF